MIYSRFINESKLCHGADLTIKSRAKELRKSLTASEKTLWGYLRNKQIMGFYFRRQHPYGIYILDFYCYKANLAIELDGKIHLGKIDYDTERTKYLESTGIKVLRFKNEDIETRREWVLSQIRTFLTNLNA